MANVHASPTGEVVHFEDGGVAEVSTEDGKVRLRFKMSDGVRDVTGIEATDVLMDPRAALIFGDRVLGAAFQATRDPRRG